MLPGSPDQTCDDQMGGRNGYILLHEACLCKIGVKTCFNAIKRMRVNPRLKYLQKKARRGELTKLKIRTNYKSGSAENWSDCALYNNK